MSFAKNNSQQISLFDATSNLTEREKKLLDKSWAKYFSENIFPNIDEAPFCVLYSERPSRHNTPINVVIGALIIKEIFHLTDEEIVETLPFDIRYQYALHTTSFEEQPLNDRSLGRFRARCNAYEEQSKIDLIHDCIIKLSRQMADMMKLNSGMRRMDSLMIASNIKKMSRLELVYTGVANLVKIMGKTGDEKLPASLKHYAEDEDHNQFLYHNRSDDTDNKMAVVLKDAALLIAVCDSRYDDNSEYQLLIRIINEQTAKDNEGKLHLKKQDSGMDAHILQNPADPDATYRMKAGKEHRGYIANVVEEADSDKSIAVDYQFEKNIYSDSQFLKDYVKRQPESNTEKTLVTDGGYCGNNNYKLAREKNIKLVTTDLKGAEVKDFFADFEFSSDGLQLIQCAEGNKPVSSVYDKSTQTCKASFQICTCRSCPHCSECNPKFHVRVATVKVGQKKAYHARQQRYLKSDEFKSLARYRNGVETVPAALRTRHYVDKMSVRGFIKCKLYFGFKIAAMNSRKLFRYLNSLCNRPLKAATI